MNTFITFTCPSCGGKMQVKDLQDRFVCPYCGNEHMLLNPNTTSPATVPALRQDVIRPLTPVPATVRMVKDGQSAAIYQRWFSLKYVPMAFFCVAWDSFLFFWYSMALSGGMPWIMIVFPVAHVAVGIGMTYSTLAGFLNRTVVEVTRDEVSVWFEPLPWLGEKHFKTADLKQFYCKENTTRSSNSRVSPNYQLYAVTKDNRQVMLLSNLDSPDIAWFFEQQIESWLKIENQPVAGEFA